MGILKRIKEPIPFYYEGIVRRIRRKGYLYIPGGIRMLTFWNYNHMIAIRIPGSIFMEYWFEGELKYRSPEGDCMILFKKNFSRYIRNVPTINITTRKGLQATIDKKVQKENNLLDRVIMEPDNDELFNQLIRERNNNDYLLRNN